MENEKKKPGVRAAVFCCIVMLITAASDALRGVFLPQFRTSFDLTESQAGHIIMVSYVGNLIFLSLGGWLSDRLPRKKFLGGVLLLWSGALCLYMLTESYPLILVGMIFSMGGSTMISTEVNLITPLMFASPAMMVSLFNFLQGIGIFLSQNVGGRFAGRLTSWHIANGILLALAVTGLIILMTLKLPDPEKMADRKGGGYREIMKSPAAWLLIPIFGCYFISEHGLMNWLTSYGSEYLGLPVSRAAMYLSLFYGALTVGRLIFAPFIDRIGVFRTVIIWSGLEAVLYCAGIILGGKGLLLLGSAGLFCSIIYPMLVVLTGKFFDPSMAGQATGFILSIGTFFDIGFNAFFGGLVEKAGYGKAIVVLPVCAVLCTVLLLVLKYGVKRSGDIR